MEKIITIDGKEVKLKSTGAYLLRYKRQFKRDAIKDLMILDRAINKDTKELEDIEALDMEIFYNMIWTLAKTANNDIPPVIEWLDEFSTFPLEEILPEAIDLIVSSIQTSVKSKKKI